MNNNEQQGINPGAVVQGNYNENNPDEHNGKKDGDNFQSIQRNHF